MQSLASGESVAVEVIDDGFEAVDCCNLGNSAAHLSAANDRDFVDSVHRLSP